MRLGVVVVVALFAALPTPTLSVLDGLPLDHPAEFILFALLATLLASRAARDAALAGIGAAGTSAIGIAAIAGLCIKLLLAAHGAHTGFIACYHGGAGSPANGCDHSFDNPFDRFNATRVDPQLQFDGNDWRLDKLNSIHFDEWRRDSAYLPPVPFSAEWTSVATAAAPQHVHVRYRGEVAISVDDHIDVFPADYSASGADGDVAIPPGRHRVVTSYRFTPPEAPESPSSRIAASLHLDAGPAIAWGTMSRIDAIGAAAVDLLALAVCLLIAAGSVRHAPRDAARVAAVVAAGLLVAVVPIGAFRRDKLLELIIVAGCLRWIWSGRPALPLAAAALALLCVLRVGCATGPAPGVTDYRLRGNDGLTYESFAHDILDDRSPQAGEDVFTLQILYRYIRFAERMVFGDQDWLLLAAILTAMNAAYSWLGRRARLLAAGHGPTLLFLTAMMLWMMNSASGSIEAPMSEYPTWLLLPVSAGLLFLGRSRRQWLIAALLMGVAALTRFNQFPAYAALLVIFGLSPGVWRRPAWIDVLACAAILGLLTFGVPLAHNYWYGHSLTVLPTNRYSTLVIDLPPGAFLSGPPREVWAMFVWKMQHLTHIGARYADSWFIPLHLLQLATLAVIVAVARGRLRPAPGHVWLLTTPLIALGVHLFYVVHYYYPRHIMFGYLLGGVVALIWIAEDGVITNRARGVDLDPVHATIAGDS